MLLKKKKKTGDPPSQGRNPGKKERAGYQFGTLTGVFTPNILTILGVVMYLRFGWVLGNVGLIPTLIIVTISTAITFLTALSVSALATNMKVQGGGAYFMISRSLGIETGAAIGLPLFLAQALGISFYVVGFSESVVQIAPLLDMRTVGTFTLFALFLIAFRSADFALKTQYIIMLFIGLSLISFFMGTGEHLLPVARKQLFRTKNISGWYLRYFSLLSPGYSRGFPCQAISGIRERLYPGGLSARLHAVMRFIWLSPFFL